MSIGAVFGDNGLIKQAEYARDLSANSTKHEEESMANSEAYMSDTLARVEWDRSKVKEIKHWME